MTRDAEPAAFRAAVINRIMVEFLKQPDGLGALRVGVRKVLLFNWGHFTNEMPFCPIFDDQVNVASCEALLGPHGYAVWRAMEIRYEDHVRRTDMDKGHGKGSKEVAPSCPA